MILRDALIAIGGGIWIGMLIHALREAATTWGGDYMSYSAAARHLVSGNSLYAGFQLDGRYPLGLAAWGDGFVYPPTAGLFSLPLALFSDTQGFVIFTALCAAFLGVVVYRIAREAGLSVTWAGGIMVAVLCSGPSIASLETGNANQLAAILLASMWLWPMQSGYLATIGALIKIYPGAGIAWAIRERAGLRGPLAVGLGLLAVSVLVLGWGAWHDFVIAWGNGALSSAFVVPSPRSALDPVLGSSLAALVGYLLAGIALLGSTRLAGRETAFLLLSIAMILPAPDWYLHYFVVPLVGAVPMISRMLAGRGVGTGAGRAHIGAMHQARQ